MSSEPDSPSLPPDPPQPKSSYEPPAILWEQPFVALAQISPPRCDPDADPNCIP